MSCSCSRSCRRSSDEYAREAAAPVPSVARAELGDVRAQSLAWRGSRRRREAVKAQRAAGRAQDNPLRQRREDGVRRRSAPRSTITGRCATPCSEAALLHDLRQHVLALYGRQAAGAARSRAERVADPRELPFVKEALASIAEGGYTEAFARVACLLAAQGRAVAAVAAGR